MLARRWLLGGFVVGSLLPLWLGRRVWWGWPVAHACLLAPTLTRNHGLWGPLTTRFRTDSRDVWLTIDDGPSPRDTPGIMDALDRHDAKASFFVIGKHVQSHGDLTREIVRRGHRVENHTFNHPERLWWCASPRRIRTEIERGSAAIFDATGCIPRAFRSPVGMTNPCVHPALDRAGLRLVGWSATGLDGLDARGGVVVERLMRRVRPGAILVLHEGGQSGRVETVELLLSRLTDAGFRCVVPEWERWMQ